MSDGMYDCFLNAQSNAHRLAERECHEYDVVDMVTCEGTEVYIYEEHVTHVVELVVEGRVTRRWIVGPCEDDLGRELDVTAGGNSWPGALKV